MANGNAPRGLIPRRQRDGETANGALNKYYVPATDATALFMGDPVIIAGSADAAGVPSVTRATAGGANRITGVVVGFEPNPAIVATGYRAASTEAYVLVDDNPATEFEIQEDSVGGALTVDSVGLNAALVAGNGSTYTRTSGWMLDSSTAATTAALQVRIVGLMQRADNEIGDYAKWLVRINEPTEMGLSTGTGV